MADTRLILNEADENDILYGSKTRSRDVYNDDDFSRAKNDANTDAEYKKAQDEKLDGEKFAKMSVEEIKRAWNAIYDTRAKQAKHKEQIIRLTLMRVGITDLEWVGTTISINTCIKWFDAMKFEEIFKTGNVFISLLKAYNIREFITRKEKYFIMLYDAYTEEVVDDYSDSSIRQVSDSLYTNEKLYNDQSQKEFDSELRKFDELVSNGTSAENLKDIFFNHFPDDPKLNIELNLKNKRNSNKIAKDVQEMRDDDLKNIISNLPNWQLKIVKDAIKDADNSR